MEYKRFTFTAPPVEILSLTHCVLGADYSRSQPHYHPFCELFFVMTGELIVEAGADYRVSAGELALVPAGRTHRERAYGDAPCEHYIVALNAAAVKALTVRPFRAFYNEAAAGLAQAAALAGGDELDAQTAQAQVCLLTLKALKAVAAEIVPPAREGGDCYDVKTYIDGNFGSDLTLDQLAAVACKSKAHLIRSFKREYGVSPMRYVKERRLAEGKTLLKSTKMDVAQIASLVGYNSAAHFTADFKAAIGLTPTAYRQTED